MERRTKWWEFWNPGLMARVPQNRLVSLGPAQHLCTISWISWRVQPFSTETSRQKPKTRGLDQISVWRVVATDHFAFALGNTSPVETAGSDRCDWWTASLNGLNAGFFQLRVGWRPTCLLADAAFCCKLF